MNEIIEKLNSISNSISSKVDKYRLLEFYAKNKKKGSKGEQITREYLKKHKFVFSEQKTFTSCTNPKTNHKLPFDFYLPFYKTILEIDGLQHSIAVDFSGHLTENEKQLNFKEQCKRDEIKNKYCEKNHIKLIRIQWNGNRKKLVNDLRIELNKLILSKKI